MKKLISLFPVILFVSALVPANAVTDMKRSCVIANRVVFVLRSNAGGFSPEQRIGIINDRLAYILGYGQLHRVRVVKQANGVATIWVGGLYFMTVTTDDAKD